MKEGLRPDIEERDEEGKPSGGPLTSSSPCVAGEFRAALDTLFETLDETQLWYIFCINPSDSQLLNQLEGRSVKGQVKSTGLVEIAKRCTNTFKVNMTPEEFASGTWRAWRAEVFRREMLMRIRLGRLLGWVWSWVNIR